MADPTYRVHDPYAGRELGHHQAPDALAAAKAAAEAAGYVCLNTYVKRSAGAGVDTRWGLGVVLCEPGEDERDASFVRDWVADLIPEETP